MLTSNQIRRLQATERWLREIRDSEEFKVLNYCPDATLGDAIQAVDELLQSHNYCHEKPAFLTDNQLQRYLEQKPVMHMRRVKTWREKISSFIQYINRCLPR
jgi:mannose/cellobiose epimerase-like protein (N-acyl-D-glucosamine 2-epimerase family)